MSDPMPAGIREKLHHFKESLPSTPPDLIYLLLQGMGIVDPDPDRCGCSAESLHDEEQLWIHLNHASYNYAVWRILHDYSRGFIVRVRVAGKKAVGNSRDVKRFGQHFLAVEDPSWTKTPT